MLKIPILKKKGLNTKAHVRGIKINIKRELENTRISP
jgi:hypothetical protein